MQKFLDIHPEVAAALASGRPVVALESTIISHGMPYPQNLAMAREVEDIIRAEGAVPATIGIIKGRIKIGLSASDLENFAQNRNVEKVSRRDFPLIVAEGKDGATTVAGTMIAAEWAGIKVFVTGGLGGVHRGVAESWDISADLTELMQTNVAVVCAGVKSILDIPKTLEVLETAGVPVIGYKTAEFPSFFTRSSGCQVLRAYDDLESVARLIKIKHEMNLKGGVVLANPIPEEDALDADMINSVIKDALAAADSAGISGKNITPFLLKNIVERTGGKSLVANIALVKNNARIGAQLAKSLAELDQGL
ncbi:MAG: pseudouridine-5'-phosphate glycosidase [Chitinophagaceae bacterium]|nr:pseudouridine-5'-phosphate glycosidase [Oligoflexus sp.]